MDHSDPAKVKDGAKRKREKEQALDRQYGTLLDTPVGRALFWDILTICGTFSANTHTDPAVMSQAEGARAVGLRISERLRKISLENYCKMLKENEKER